MVYFNYCITFFNLFNYYSSKNFKNPVFEALVTTEYTHEKACNIQQNIPQENQTNRGSGIFQSLMMIIIG